MKRIFTIIYATVLSQFAFAQDAAKPVVDPHAGHNHEVKKDNVITPAAETLSLKESEYDFGKIPQGKPVTYIFTFTNSGTTALTLDNVQTSCGCTTPEWSKEPVAPGGSSKITVGYNAASEGSFSKSINITYNGTQTKQLIIKGEVWKAPVTPAPENKALGTLKN